MFTSGINISVMAMWGSMTNSTMGNHELHQMRKTSSICTMLCEVTDETVLKRYQWK
jgi:hypothetical protein